MVLSVARYAGVSARVRGLKGRLLTSAHWHDLLAADDLAGVVEILRQTDYADVLNLGEGGGLRLEQAERRLLGRAASNCRKCMTFLQGSAHTLLSVWWQHFELENLKAVFRGVQQGLPAQRIQAYQIPLEGVSTLPWETLLNERSIPHLIERLDGTHYVNPLRNALHLYQRDKSLFALEVALDVRYYRDIAVAIKHLGAGEQREARRLFGSYIDILNLLWAYRYRVYYKLSAEEIVNYTLWHTVHTDVTLIRDIALGAAPQDIVSRIWGASAVDLTVLDQTDQETEMLPLLELALMRFWRKLASQAMYGSPLRLGLILGYLILEELEVQDLVALLEAKSLGWSREQIVAHLYWVEE